MTVRILRLRPAHCVPPATRVHWLSRGKLKDAWMADAASRTSVFKKSSVLRQLPVPRQALCPGELLRGHPTGCLIPICSRTSVALRGIKVVEDRIGTA